MHVSMEAARKAAGISGMTKNYPDNPKHRRAGYWAAYNGSLSNEFARADQREKDLMTENKKLSRELVTLEHSLNTLRERATVNGVEVLRHQEGWSHDRGTQVTSMLVGKNDK